MKTPTLKPTEVQPNWWLVDASDKVLGRMATQISQVLMGKHRPDYTPHVVCGDFVVVVNAEKVKLTGQKWRKRTLDKYTGYTGGRKEATLAELRDKRPGLIIEHSVSRMLPKNKLQKIMMRRLKVYAGAEHPHQAQRLQELPINA